MSKYIYGIDVAQMLNYCGIVVTTVDEKIKIKTIRKLKNLTYPEIIENVLGDLFNRFPPAFICVDFTNEKSFSQTVETHLNPAFVVPGPDYQKWRYVEPVVFTTDMKLQLKQNARELFEREKFVWPQKIGVDPRIWGLVDELRDQVLRESAMPGLGGQLRFPKPQGYDNDLAIALELNLYAAKRFLQAPQKHGPKPKWEKWRQYICHKCREEDHPNGIHVIYWETTGYIRCPCKTCVRV